MHEYQLRLMNRLWANAMEHSRLFRILVAELSMLRCRAGAQSIFALNNQQGQRASSRVADRFRKMEAPMTAANNKILGSHDALTDH